MPFAGTHRTKLLMRTDMTDFAELTYPRLLRVQAKTRPDRLSVVTPTDAVTWKRLHDDAMLVSAALLELGVGRGDKVAILLPNRYEWLTWAYGAAGIGAVVVPVNTRFQLQELAYQLNASDTHTLVLQPSIGSTDFLALILELVPELKSTAPGSWRSEALPQLLNVVCIDEHASRAAGILDRSCVPSSLSTALISRVRDAQDAVQPADPSIIQYTSGTTAFPKGVVLSHYGTARNALHVGQRLQVVAEDRMFLPGPFFHVAGVTLGMLLSLITGAPLYTLPKFDPPAVLDVIKRERITVYTGVDSLFLMLLKHPDFQPSFVSSVEKGYVVSSPEIVRMVRRDMGMKGIVNLYGISEASPNIAIGDLSEAEELQVETSGLPHPDCELRIADPAGKVLPAGEVGEIQFRGYSLMLGYYKDPVATAKAIDDDGWLHTGDQGLLRESGHLIYRGRIKDILRVGGENFAPVEVEEILCQHPKIRQAAVIGIPDTRLVEVPAAVIELREAEQCTAEEITDYCARRLAAYKVPRAILFVDKMPMTGSGKIQKFPLRDLFRKPMTGQFP
jgi:acyl-CoA synthetase (AMP-forming)/AMP-acid ligase II